MSPRFHVMFAVAMSLVVAATIAMGFYLAGSPAARRVARLDQQRLRDLQQIAREIHFMTVERGADGPRLKAELPKSLEDAAKRATDERLNLNDPQTGAPYAYKGLTESTFELCASFIQPRAADESVFWNHPAGEHCFVIDVLDPPPFY